LSEIDYSLECDKKDKKDIELIIEKSSRYKKEIERRYRELALVLE